MFIPLQRSAFFSQWLRLLLAIGIGLLCHQSMGQELGDPFIRNYSPREYKASSANYHVAQDRRGVMFFANFRGVLTYDGNSWEVIPMPNEAMVYSVATDSMGNIWIGGMGDFGYLRPEPNGKLVFESLKSKVAESNKLGATDLIEVFGLKQGAMFTVVGSGRIFLYEHGKLRTEDIFPGQSIDQKQYYRGELWFSPSPGVWKAWRKGQFRTFRLEGAASKAGLETLVPWGKDTALVKVKNGGIRFAIFQGTTIRLQDFSAEVDNWLSKTAFTRLVALNNGWYLLSGLDAGAIIFDRQGHTRFVLDDAHGLQDNHITHAMFDKQMSLWLTLSKGISRAEIASPLTQWRESSGLRGIVFAAQRYQGRLYAATTLGLFRMENGHFEQVDPIDQEASLMRQIVIQLPGNRQTNRLLIRTSGGLFEINGNAVAQIVAIKGILDLRVSKYHPNRIYFSLVTSQVMMMEWKNGKWLSPQPIAGLDQRFELLTEDEDGHLWMSEVLGKPGVVRLVFDSPGQPVPSKILRYEDPAFPPVSVITKLKGDLIFMTDAGPYRFDGQQDGFVKDDSLFQMLGGGQARILRMAEDDAGRLWLERQRNFDRWVELARPRPNGSYVRDSVHLRALAGLEVWSDIYVEENGVAWIGTPEGLYRYDGRGDREPFAQFPPLIRRVVVQPDSLLFGGAFEVDDRKSGVKIGMIQPSSCVPRLPYKNNSLTFYCSAPFYEDEGEVRFSYFLKGYDSGWSAWTWERKREYTLLPPGQYSFQVKALTPYDQATSIVAFDFEIRPPWYRTYWALIGYGLLLGLVIYGLIKLNVARLKMQNENLERLVFDRTAEIWEQNKEIVKKTVALKRQKEEITEKGELLEEKNKNLETAINQLQSAQLKLVESEKMASLGQLTAGIAHEINNPINYVKGNISPLKRDFEEIRGLFSMILEMKSPDRVEECVVKIQKAIADTEAEYLFEEMALLLSGIEEGANRTKEIVDGLRAFSRAESTTFKEADIHQGLDATLTLLDHALKDHIQVIKEYGSIPSVECLPGKLNQVFMNVLNNAIQAVDEQDTTGPQAEIRIKTGLKGDQVFIEISDTGQGMPPDVKDKIFEPFFTTKEVGKGTGLGLSISFGIIEQHHGSIDVQSTPGKGSVFTITIPVRQSAAVTN